MEKIYLPLLLALFLMTCQSEPTSIEKASSEASRMQTDVLEAAVTDCEASIDPYTFLVMVLGNAESMEYTVKVLDAETAEIGKTIQYSRRGETISKSYTERNMDGKAIKVRTLEIEGYVQYIFDEYRLVKVYLMSNDELLEAANAIPDSVLEQDGYTVYEYNLPFIQDDSIVKTYLFFMEANVLKKVQYNFDGRAKLIYEYSNFSEKVTDESVFILPKDYEIQNFDYSYEGDSMPPWWEIGIEEGEAN